MLCLKKAQLCGRDSARSLISALLGRSTASRLLPGRFYSIPKQSAGFKVYAPTSNGSIRAVPLVLVSPYGDWVWQRNKFVDFFTQRGFEVMTISTSDGNAEQQENDLVQAIRNFPFPPITIAHSFSSVIVSKYLESNPVSAVIHMCPYTPITPLHIVSQYTKKEIDLFLSKTPSNSVETQNGDGIILSRFPCIATNHQFLRKQGWTNATDEPDFPGEELFLSANSFSSSAALDIIRSPPLIEPNSVRMCLVRGLQDNLVDSDDIAWVLQRHEIVPQYIIDDFVLQRDAQAERQSKNTVEVDEDEDSLITMTESGHFPMLDAHSHSCAAAILSWINRRF